jgi:polyisoprenoid-binding protein YceI
LNARIMPNPAAYGELSLVSSGFMGTFANVAHPATIRSLCKRWRWTGVSSKLFRMNGLCVSRYLLLALVLALLPSFAAFAAMDDTYRYDPVHSQIVFSVDHDNFSRPFGRLHIARGVLHFDPKDWSRSSTELDIDMSSLDMGNAEWNAAVCKPALLDCKQTPLAHFVSTSVEQKDATHGVLHGQLSMHGTTQPIDIPFQINRVGRSLFDVHVVAGFSGTAALDRTAYGIDAFSNSIGHDVSIWLSLEAIRDNQAATNTKGSP